MKTLLAVAIITAASSTSLMAAPWTAWSGEIDGATVHQAYQTDTGTGFELTYTCNNDTRSQQITIIGAERYEEGADYAPEVPAVVTVDTQTFDFLDFRFEKNRRGYLAVVAVPEGQALDFNALVNAMSRAQVSVSVVYFDKSMRFAAEGASNAIEAARTACGV